MSSFDIVSILGQMAETSADPRIRQIVKSLSSSQAGTELTALTGGGAMRIESLEPELATSVVQNQHFVLFNKLFPNRHNTWSLIDQQVVQDGIGGYPGSSVANEKATNVPERQGSYRREVTELKMLAEYGGITVPTALQGALQQAAGVADFSASEQEIFSSLSRVLQSAEWQLLFGDASIDNLEFTGVIPSILSRSPAQNIADMAGASLNSGGLPAALAAKIAGFGSWGSPDCMICSPLVKADFDAHLESAYRINLDSNIPNTEIGALVRAIRYNGLGVGAGILELEPHVFLDERIKMPVYGYAPDAVTGVSSAGVAGVAAVNPASKFVIAHAGNYIYAVEAAGGGHVSNIVNTAGIAVAAGQGVTLTIQPSATGWETYYNVYRSRKNGTGGVTDLRFIGRIKKAVGPTTTFVDLNENIPGTSNALVLTTAPQFGALRLLQMAPPSKLPLAMTALEYRFVIFYLMALRFAMPKKLGLIKNILPSQTDWNPFT